PPTGASASTRCCSRAPPGRASQTRAPEASRGASSTATTSSRRATSIPAGSASVERDPQRRQLLLQLGRHLLVHRLTHVDAQALLEPVAPATLLALVEVGLRLAHLLVGEHPIEVRLHHLLAVRAV